MVLQFGYNIKIPYSHWKVGELQCFIQPPNTRGNHESWGGHMASAKCESGGRAPGGGSGGLPP